MLTAIVRPRFWLLAALIGVGLALALAAGVAGSEMTAADLRPDATVRYVAPGAACGAATPCYATIQAAVDAAAAGDEIRVATGVYAGVSARGGLTQTIYLNKGLTLRGGFTTADWSTPNPTANPVTVDAQGLGRGLVISGTQSLVTVDGLRITGGNATGLAGYPGGRDAGGGVYVFSATVTVRNSVIYSNTASSSTTVRGYGGGVAALNSTLTVESSTLESNQASTGNRGYGGGIMAYNDPGQGGPVTLTGATIRNNIASSANSGAGGGVWLYSCTGSLTGNTIRDNAGTTAAGAAGDGGGIYASTCDLTLGNNTVQGNRGGAIGSGGGIYFYDVMATLTGNQVVGNRAGDGKSSNGGGLYATSDLYTRVAELILQGNTFRDNVSCRNDGPATAICRGGGLRLGRLKLALTDNTIQDNTALVGALINDNGWGGGVFLYEPFDTTLSGNTVQGNVACNGGFGFGGGIVLTADLSRSAAIALTANTVQSNTASLAHTGNGDGAYASNISGTLSSNVIAGNTGSKGREGYGGGVYAEGGNLTLLDNAVEGNIASTADRGVGGGLRFGSTTRASTVAVLIGNRIRGNVGSSAAANTAGWPSGSGGLELWLTGGVVSANTFTGNVGATAQAAYCGGAAIHTGDTAAVTFVGNDLPTTSAGWMAARAAASV